MRLQKRVVVDWGITRIRAALKRRGVRRGIRVVCQSSGWVRLEAFEILAPGPGEVLVRVALSAVSPGTERAMYNRLPNTQVTYPYTPGYSAVGTVLEAGRGVHSVRPGQRVAGHIPHASLACVRVDRCVQVPARAGDREAAFVTLGVIALQGVRKAGIRFGDRVAVLGQGVLGILAARGARIGGASEVAICGRNLQSDSRQPIGGRYDVVLDVTGNPDAVTDAVRLAAPGARIVLIGSSRGISPPLLSDGRRPPPIEIRGAHAAMVPERESQWGRWTFVDEAQLYMDWLVEGRLVPFDPPLDVIDPREAWHFYRRLGRGQPRVQAAVFDWDVLPDGMRFRSGFFLLPPACLRPDPEGERRAARVPRLRGSVRTTGTRGSIVSARTGEPGRKLRVAFLGCGEIALSNARAVADSGVAEIRWAIDTHLDLARDLAGRWGGRAAGEIAPALADREIDAVIVCTPHHLHAPICVDALAAGKHVLVEKPMARDAREAAPMIEASRKAGVVLSTCFPRRFLPEILAARSLVRQGALGRVLGARIAEHLHREMAYWFGGSSGRSRSDWRARRDTSGGGVLLMNLCHHLDTLFFVTGLRAGRVFCESDRFTAPGDVEDQVALTVRMTEGAMVSLDASTCTPGGGERAFQIWGTDGQIALDDPPRFLSLKRTPFGTPNDWNRLPCGGERQARRDFVRAFAAAVLDGQPNPAPPEEALAVQLLIDAAYRSAERGEALVVPSELDHSTDVASNR
jgi:predicted dehydrogenase/threonine dehydrogenase-like Zn-dependent dehydrogenase